MIRWFIPINMTLAFYTLLHAPTIPGACGAHGLSPVPRLRGTGPGDSGQQRQRAPRAHQRV